MQNSQHTEKKFYQMQNSQHESVMNLEIFEPFADFLIEANSQKKLSENIRTIKKYIFSLNGSFVYFETALSVSFFCKTCINKSSLHRFVNSIAHPIGLSPQVLWKIFHFDPETVEQIKAFAWAQKEESFFISSYLDANTTLEQARERLCIALGTANLVRVFEAFYDANFEERRYKLLRERLLFLPPNLSETFLSELPLSKSIKDRLHKGLLCDPNTIRSGVPDDLSPLMVFDLPWLAENLLMMNSIGEKTLKKINNAIELHIQNAFMGALEASLAAFVPEFLAKKEADEGIDELCELFSGDKPIVC